MDPHTLNPAATTLTQPQFCTISTTTQRQEHNCGLIRFSNMNTMAISTQTTKDRSNNNTNGGA